MSLHRYCYQKGLAKPHVFGRPVISVGNLTWGGTGKTPMVDHLARFFVDRGQAPLVLARGYGNDESKELKRKLPSVHFGFGKNRFAAGQKSLSSHPCDVIILDDGFQHWSIKRDAELVVISMLNPFGNGALIPRGILREPIHGLKRASIIALIDVNFVPRKEVDDLKARICRIAPNVDFVEAYHEPLYFYRPNSRERVYLDRLQGVRATTFSGVGTPRSFLTLLNRLGVKTVRNFEFGDHHCFTDGELKEIQTMKESSESQEVITTEKDFFRCEEAITKILRPLVLKVRLSISAGENVLYGHLARLTGTGHASGLVTANTGGAQSTQDSQGK